MYVCRSNWWWDCGLWVQGLCARQISYLVHGAKAYCPSYEGGLLFCSKNSLCENIACTMCSPFLVNIWIYKYEYAPMWRHCSKDFVNLSCITNVNSVMLRYSKTYAKVKIVGMYKITGKTRQKMVVHVIMDFSFYLLTTLSMVKNCIEHYIIELHNIHFWIMPL